MTSVIMPTALTRAACSVCCALVVLGSSSTRSHDTPPEILWDRYGIPHVFATQTEGLFYAFGWAQMASHANLLLRLYGQARGRAAEYWGDAYRDGDEWMHLNDVPRRAERWLALQDADFRRGLEAFAAGINEYARAYPSHIAPEAAVVLPVSAADVLGHTQRMIYFQFLAPPRLRQRSAEPAAAPSSGGSNAFAIGRRRSASGHALLLANPHLPWSGEPLFYEAQLVMPGADLYGATFVGFPVLGMAFNDDLGWSHTVNPMDAADQFELTLAAGGYTFDGAVQAFESNTVPLKVKQPDGTLREETLTIKRSVQGPIISERGGRAVALKVAGLDQPGMLRQWWDMGRARTLAAFEAAVRRLQLPLFSIVYADRDGHIMHVFNGRVPRRPPVPVIWTRIVPGETSATLWTSTHGYDELPRVLDPRSDWVQNANDPPWTTTLPPPLDPEKFPSYLAPRRPTWRAQRAARMLNGDDHITFAEAVAYKHSTRVELADRMLEPLVRAARTHGSGLARQAADVLAAWDRHVDAGSRGAVLFERLARQPALQDAALWEQPWTLAAAGDTPRGLARPEVVVEALERAARDVLREHQRLDVGWGEVYRLRRGSLDLPGHGGPGEPLGVYRTVQYSPERRNAIGGDSYVAIVEFSRPLRARALLTYGNASQPGTPHETDQLPLFARKELRPVWRTRTDILANLEYRERLVRQGPRPAH
jgi:acyl-homoserine-lactone acylase